MLNIAITKPLPEFQLDFSLNIAEETGAIILTGPSGAGKTTLLRCICGLDSPQNGYISAKNEIFYDSQQKVNKSPAVRGVGVCFQDYLLFPHLTVQENIIYGLRKAENNIKSKEQVAFVAEQLCLNNRLLNCYPGQLSGGEKQRVALARALMRGKNMLLLDEPFNALDKDLRQNVAQFIKNWISNYQIPAIIVSHLEEDKAFQGELEIRMERGKYHQDGTTNRAEVNKVVDAV